MQLHGSFGPVPIPGDTFSIFFIIILNHRHEISRVDDALRRLKNMNTNVAEDFGGAGYWGGQKSVLIAAVVDEDNHTLDK